jgi:hypothetical protein
MYDMLHNKYQYNALIVNGGGGGVGGDDDDNGDDDDGDEGLEDDDDDDDVGLGDDIANKNQTIKALFLI